MTQSDSDDFELVDSLDLAKSILADKKPDLGKVRAWLAPTKYSASSSEYHRHLSSQAPGTGEWIRETTQFQQWHTSSEHGSIWIKAVPGAGKSVVAASMADSLAQKESFPVLTFFFRQIIETNRTSRALLRDWLAQLLPTSEILQVSLWEIVEDERALETISTEQLWKLLLSALRSVERAYMVVDALDESSFDEDFLARLNALGSFRPAHVKVLMTSRPKQYLQRAMKDPQVIHVSLEEELVKRDISAFVNQRISQLPNVGVESQQLIHAAVCARSEGLFLYARLMLDQITKSVEAGSHDLGSVRHMVTKLPHGLQDMYNKMLFENAVTSGVDHGVQILILQLCTQSARPMRLIEIAKAIETIYPELTQGSKDIVRTACGPLLEIMEDEVVQILHHSFTEFLLDSGRLNTAQAQFPVINPLVAHRSIAKACLAVLQGDAFREFRDDEKDDDQDDLYRSFPKRSRFDFSRAFLRYPLVEYAAKKWSYHAKHYDIEDPLFFTELEMFCNLEMPHFNAWLQLMSQSGEVSIAKRATPLHVAAALGLVSWAEHLVTTGANVDKLDQSKNTPLFWAAKSGHAGVVRVVLDAGAQADLDGYDGLKPLHMAASRNHVEVVKLLVAAGVSPTTPKTRDIGRTCGNAATSVGHSPLRYASMAGHVESVVAMLPYVTQTEDLGDALCWAAQGGHSLLLAAILNNSTVSPDGRLKIRRESCSVTTGGETALILAASSLDSACVRILLEKGADARKHSFRNRDDGWAYSVRKKPRIGGATALHSLVRSNITKESEGIARQILDSLLAAGADLEARDHHGDTALLSTVGNRWSYGNDIPITIAMLLEVGADAFATNDNGDSLLHKTCQTSSGTDTAKLLLDSKISPSQHRTSDGATPLHVSMANIHCPAEMAKLLFIHGADINAVDTSGNTALITVCKDSNGRHSEAVDALLELGTQVNVQNELGQTCLHLFNLRTDSYNDNKDQVKSIIRAGADLELRDREGKTVLLYAVEKSNEPLVKTLLQCSNAVITARTFRHGKSALHLAVHSRSALKMIETLVEKGADPTWTDNDGNTLLHELAARFESCDEDVALVEKLVELGVPTEGQNCRRRTFLHVMPAIPNNNGSRGKACRETMASTVLKLAPNLDVNAADIDGYTPLHLVSAASEAQTSKLLQLGARIDVKSFDLRTPLHCAARARQSGIVSMLINHGTKRNSSINWLGINAIDKDGCTPLHDACRSGRPESVRILLDAGADVNVEGQRYRTPLRVCAEFTEEDKLWSCLRNGTTTKDEFRPNDVADTNSYNEPPDTSQHDTARVGPIVAMLLEAGATGKESHTLLPTESALSAAIDARCSAMVDLLRRQSPCESPEFEEVQLIFNSRNAAEMVDEWKRNGPKRCSPRLISKIDDNTMDIFIAKGIDFTKIEGDYRGYRTSISAMAGLGLTEKMRKVAESAKLLDRPRDPEDEDKLRPVLHDACDRPVWNMEMLKILVAVGHVNVNAHQQIKERVNYRDSGKYIPGPTALHVLAQGRHWWQIEAIKFLVDNGAEVDSLDEHDQTPLDVASSCVRYGSIISQAFFRPQCCDMLLKLGANANRVNKRGLVPLNLAGFDEAIIKVLLRHSADVNAGIKGVLMSAVEAGDVHGLRIYLQNGADCNIPDLSSEPRAVAGAHKQALKKYPLLTAALPPSYGGWDSATSRKMLDLLLDHGAKYDLTISDDETLIHYIFRRAPTSALRAFIDRKGLNLNIKDQKGRNVFLAACESCIDCENNGSMYIPHAELGRLRAEYTPAYLALADSELYASQIDYLATDNDGKHVINYLLPKWNDRIAERFLPVPGVRDLICQKDKNGYSPLHHTLQALNVTASLRFIDEGNADLIDPDPDGDTALHYLYRCHWVSNLPRFQPLMDRYLRLGGDMNAANKTGETPLHAFLRSSHERLRGNAETADDDDFNPFDFLINNGTDFEAVKHDGQTALHVVARRGEGGSVSVESDAEGYNARLFRKLVDLGCDPLQEDKEGRTALDVAAAIGNDGILKLYQRRKT